MGGIERVDVRSLLLLGRSLGTGGMLLDRWSCLAEQPQKPLALLSGGVVAEEIAEFVVDEEQVDCLRGTLRLQGYLSDCA